MSSVAIRTDTWPPALVYWGLQPTVLVFTYCCAAGMFAPLDGYAGVLAVFVVLSLAEEVWPARRDWRQTWSERFGAIAMFVLSSVAIAIWQEFFPALFAAPLVPVRAIFSPLWPAHLAMPVQAFLAFLLLQFFAYWLHRLQHRVSALWQATGHGLHHTYTRLNAINWNSNHPLEAVFLVAPVAILTIMFGLGQPAAIAAFLAIANAACAHLNVRVNDRLIGLVLTTNLHHVHHHSADYRESNTNYGCSAIIWDRVFGTFERAETERLGDFATEPSFFRKLVLPFFAAAGSQD